jgi:hypothetical protein
MPNLPPLVGNVKAGEVAWKRLESIDYETLGFFLSTHLIIEHYLIEFVKANIPKLNWDSADLSANQKIQLLSKFPIVEPYGF